VQLVEEGGIGWQVRFHERARLLVPGAWRNQAMTGQHATRVGVGDEHRPSRRVEKDDVDGLGPEARNAEQLGAQGCQRRPAQPVEAAAVAIEEPAREAKQAPRLLAIRPRRADQGPELGLGDGGEAARVEHPARAERSHGSRGVRPRRVLDQDGADGDLVWRASGPPALRSQPIEQRHVQAEQARLDGIARRARDPAVGRQRARGLGGPRGQRSR